MLSSKTSVDSSPWRVVSMEMRWITEKWHFTEKSGYSFLKKASADVETVLTKKVIKILFLIVCLLCNRVVYWRWTIAVDWCVGAGERRSSGRWRRVRLLLTHTAAAVLQLHTGQDVCCPAAKGHGRASNRLSYFLQEVCGAVVVIWLFVFLRCLYSLLNFRKDVQSAEFLLINNGRHMVTCKFSWWILIAMVLSSGHCHFKSLPSVCILWM